MQEHAVHTSTAAVDREKLEALYGKYNRREYVHPDPLEFLYDYPDPLDREIIGLVASSLAYGGVKQILKSVRTVLDRMPSPAKFLRDSSRDELSRTFGSFKHRFTTGEELASMLYGAGRVIERYGSLEKCVVEGFIDGDETILPGLCRLVDEISKEAGRDFPHLLPHPCRMSACKRLNLYMRWMVRRDDIDPGGWYTVEPIRLIIPVDVHMFRICRALGITERRQANLRTAVEITDFFRRVSPGDPVKYDFALTRLGIRDELDASAFIDECLASSGGAVLEPGITADCSG